MYLRLSIPSPGEGMMDHDDRSYYLERIAAEESAAEKAAHPQAAESHKQLAKEYSKLVERDQTVSAD